MKHTVTVSDNIWKWAQVESGLTNPATWLRELINEARVAALAQAPQPPNQKVRWDPGTDIVLNYDRKCVYCGEWMDAGDSAKLFTIGPRGQKAVSHPNEHKPPEEEEANGR